MDIWLALTEARNEPRWLDDGSPNVETFIDGLFTDAEAAKQVVPAMCNDEPARWWRTRRGWLSGHHWRVGEDRVHFHRIQLWTVDDPNMFAYVTHATPPTR
jgi:hypothetical protein